MKLNSVGRKIFVNSIDDKTNLIKQLKERKINFYSHPEQNSKTFKAILSGLPQIDTARIEESLKEANITPTKIIMFNTKSVNKLYLLHFNAETVNKKTLNEIKYVYHHVITWLPYKPKRKGPTQCMRCLMYGHGISSCNRYTVCMLCAGPHLTKECTTHNDNTNTNTDFKCFNCMSAGIEHNHKANNVNCPFRSKYEQARTNARNETTNNNNETNTNKQRTQTITNQPPPKPSSQISYADTIRASTASSSRTQSNTTRSQSQTHSNPNENLDNNPSSNLWSFNECADLLFDSIEKLQKCKTKLNQLKVIANLLKNACK